MKLALAFAAVTFTAPVAFGQAPPPPPPPDPSMQPAGTDVAPAQSGGGWILPNMLPSRYGATIDFRTDYSYLGDEFLSDDLFILGMNLHGQYIAPENYGAYFAMPYYYASVGDESEQGVGNIEIGGLYKVPSGPNSEVLVRAGFAIDTAGQIGSLFAPISQIYARTYDGYTAGFGSHWLRGEGSFRHDEGSLHIGISGGIDVPVGGDDEGEDGGISLNVDAFAKGAVSLAYQEPGSPGIGVGLVMIQALGTEGDSDDNTVFAANVDVAVPVSATMSLYGAFGYPDIENNEFDVFAVGAGLRAAIN